ncbi:MAG: hypothetical protein U1C57_03040, partial [Candidatus Doudnabacteria bacterium]|nr:hypothetical protein [Candidatus Doudnabacteria bacterium]
MIFFFIVLPTIAFSWAALLLFISWVLGTTFLLCLYFAAKVFGVLLLAISGLLILMSIAAPRRPTSVVWF